jgi:hypothetical protein
METTAPFMLVNLVAIAINVARIGPNDINQCLPPDTTALEITTAPIASMTPSTKSPLIASCPRLAWDILHLSTLLSFSWLVNTLLLYRPS